MTHSRNEIEVKLAVASAAEARRRLRRQEFSVWRPRVLEANTLFDTAGQALRSSGTLLRVREAGRVFTVTYKGPAQVGRHKTREELEFGVTRADTATEVLRRLGYAPVFRYEKYRTEFRHAASRGTATVDETPVGVYMELEGLPSWIDRTARRLGFTTADYITASYGRLYLDWCAARGIEPTHMVFPKR